jgi:DNA recombination protein RmuC
MNQVLLSVSGVPVTFGQGLAGALGAIALLLLAVVVALARGGAARRGVAEEAAERQRDLEARIAAIVQSNAELGGRLGSMSEWLGARQAEMTRVMAERLDHVGVRLGAGLESHAQATGASLNKLNERLAVIDAAQARMAGIGEEVVSLKDILANKQTRGAFGQGRMEAIVRDGLPAGAYEFQYTLSNRARPDCAIRLPDDPRVLAVDAKFPLEAFTAHSEARTDEARKAAASRVRVDIGKHVKDIAERYLLPGETQDIALMFVPSESIYSDLLEHFDDVVQRAHRARVIIVSPSLMMMAIQVTQAILRDARMRDEAHAIHAEVGKLLNDVRLLAERTARLETHFRQAQEDVGMIATSAEKVTRRAARIDAMEFGDEGDAKAETRPNLRLARGGE